MITGRRLRIAVVAACPLPVARGTPIRIFHLSEALHELGHDVHVVTYHLGQKHVPHAFRLHRIKDLGWYSRMQAGPSYRKLAVNFYLENSVMVIHNIIYSNRIFSVFLNFKFSFNKIVGFCKGN